MKLANLLTFVMVLCCIFFISLIGGGCAQIGLPTGGAKDTLAPKLVKANPPNGSKNVTNNKITIDFDEYIEVQDVQKNLIVSPLQNKTPTIITNAKGLVIKFKDSLLANTTYSLNFGDAIKDVNEGNVYKNLTYTFSTGNIIDSLSISGNVLMAETGNIDSTLMVMLYRNAIDSAVTKRKPNYVAKVNSDGSFEFNNLPADSFKIYALKDGDGGKTYNAPTEIFAFNDKAIYSKNDDPIRLYAYAEKKEEPVLNRSITKPKLEKKLKITNNSIGLQDLFEPKQLQFNNYIKYFDSTKIKLLDTFFTLQPTVNFFFDSTRQILNIEAKWQVNKPYILVIDTLAVKDSVGNKLAKMDTIKFTTKRQEDYGKITLRFNNLDFAKKPVLQFLQGEVIKKSYSLKNSEWSNSMFAPGDYTVRILYDTNGDGEWTPGNYSKKRQPEIAVTLPQKLSIKGDWENEKDINL